MQTKFYLACLIAFLIQATSNAQNLIVNPGAESALSTGWQIVSQGTDCNGSSDWRVQGGQNGFPAAHEGSHIFYSGCNFVKGVIYQDIDVSHLAGDIDDMNINFTFTGYMQVANEDPSDGAQMIVEYKNASGITLVSYNTGIQKVKGVWTPYTSTLTSPPGIRTVRITLKSYTYNGSSVDAYFDDLSLYYVKIVPLKLISFDVMQEPSGAVKATWRTANEMNNDYFELQRSADGSNWEAVARVKGAGTTNTGQSYSVKDLYPLNGQSYYRLRQVDFDGKESMSKVKTLKIAGTELSVRAYPNPVSDKVVIEGSPELLTIVRIYNAFGKEITQGLKIVPVNTSKKEIQVSGLPRGVYYIRTNGETVSFVKN
ncbi:MAG: T9SS type A sorting domain-containing protein [Chitinophagaceae bacterium]|nr:T9SS type A sorting domain-containing protein [Chitinophagaceae bacterium]